MTPQSVTHIANGATVAFSFPFAVFEPGDIEVLVNGAVQTFGFGLFGLGSSDGGAIRFDSAPADGTAVTIRRTGRAQVSGSDAPGFLENKIVAGDQITITKTFDAAGEHLTIAADIDPAQFQPRDADLDWVSANLTDAGKALAGAADAAAQRAALGLAAVASSGSYADLSDKPNLGSVASHAFEEFASAAQGAKADGALQSSAIGTTVQTHSANLDWVSANLTNAGKTLAGAADAAAQRAALGLPSSAVSGSYNDLSDRPILGSVASHSFEEFASAAQGAKAESALQSSAVDTNATLDANSNDKVPSQKAVKTYVDGKISVAAATTVSINDQLALTNLRLLLNSSVSTGALIQGKQWELAADEWASDSTGQSLVAAGMNYYSGLVTVKQTYSYTGADQTSTVPVGAVSAVVKLWGAGGGSTGQTVASGNADFAGGGGFVSGTMAVTPGHSLTIVVGQGGSVNAGASYGGGGAGSTNAGSGGGRSAIRYNGADLVTAGGGGGSSNNDANTQSGGVGGGTTGGSGIGGGSGGAQDVGGTAGGGAGAMNGSQYTGGAGYAGGGGGGGGYYGGGGGAIYGAGGGGSSYVAVLSNVTNTQAPGYVAAGSGDADYVAGIGYGQQGSEFTSGNGRVVIIYTINQNMTLVSPAVSLSAAPTYADLYALYKDDSGSAVLGIDLTVELSRDGGTTWSTASITPVAAYDGSYGVIRARAALSGQPAGTSLKARIKTFNTKAQRIAAPALYAE